MRTEFCRHFFLIAASLLLMRGAAYACPDIDGLVDINCDGELNIVTFGDSITYGRGDSQYRGGYPGRLEEQLPHAQVANLGRPGENTHSGRHRASQQFPWFFTSDYFIILEGVNDFWMSGHSAPSTVSNLYSMVRQAQSYGAVALLANLTPIRRSNQRSWVASVNIHIGGSRQVDFYSLGDSIISGDLIHPNAWGYDRMTTVALNALRAYGSYYRPADNDHDGIYDFAESRFGTSPASADTDGDGILDGEEVFTYGSSPLSLDSDGDGFSDYEEIRIMHSNPASAAPTAPRLDSIEVLPNT